MRIEAEGLSFAIESALYRYQILLPEAAPAVRDCVVCGASSFRRLAKFAPAAQLRRPCALHLGAGAAPTCSGAASVMRTALCQAAETPSARCRLGYVPSESLATSTFRLTTCARQRRNGAHCWPACSIPTAL